EEPGEIPLERDETFWARKIARPEDLPDQVSSVNLARRPREVQAQLGLTGIEPLTKELQGRRRTRPAEWSPRSIPVAKTARHLLERYSASAHPGGRAERHPAQ